MKMTAVLRTEEGLKARSFVPAPARDFEPGRPAALIAELLTRPEHLLLMCVALEIGAPLAGNHPDCAALISLSVLGVTAARIVKEKGRFRLPLKDEASEGAFLLPVAGCDRDGVSRCMIFESGHQFQPEDCADRIADVVALPFDGSRALSMMGLTAALGTFQPSQDGRLTLLASGAGFLKRHAARARAALKDYPPQLVWQFLPALGEAETLILDARALDWRMQSRFNVVPEAAREVACPDSPALARFVDAAMKERDQVRKAPQVLAPKGGVS
jgi:hypothetical protein